MTHRFAAFWNMLVAFLDKTIVKVIYAFLAFCLAFIMFLVATDTGSILDWAIFFLLVYIGVLDTVTVTRRLAHRTKKGGR